MFLKKIFKMFKLNKEIKCPKNFDISKDLVKMTNCGGQEVFVDKKILVERNTKAVFRCRDKITDSFTEGNHFLNPSTLPNTYAKLKLNKLLEKGKPVKKFKCDVYYLNLNPIENFIYYSNEPFFTKSIEFGKIKGLVEGCCKIQIVNPEQVLEFMLQDYPYLKDGVGERVVALAIGNIINSAIDKSKYELMDLIKSKEEVRNFLECELESCVYYHGFRVTNLQINAISFKGKKKKELDEYIKAQHVFGPPRKAFFANKRETENTVELSYEKLAHQNSENQMQTVTHGSNNVRCYCKNCGAEISNQDVFCRRCGYKQN